MKKKIILFNVDSALIDNKNKINNEMLDILESLNNRSDIDIGFIEGPNLNYSIDKIGEKNLDLFSWKLNDDGLFSCKDDINCDSKDDIKDFMGEKHFMKFTNIILKNLSKIELPIKRGSFIKYRKNTLTISPIGTDSNNQERREFRHYDKQHKIRETLTKMIKRDWLNYCYYDDDSFSDLDKIDFYIPRSSSKFHIFLKASNKMKLYSPSFFENKYDTIYYFGNELYNNYELFNNLNIIHNIVKTYKDTIEILNKI